jgi:AhpD family alkylhydroperoxidase
MEARMQNPAMVFPDALTAIQGLIKATRQGGVPHQILELVHLRASQINGCSVCVYGGAHAAKQAGETDERLWSLAAWREAPFYSDAERAALALTESVTRLADGADAAPDGVWAAVERHFDEPGLASLILTIAMTNFFNRVNATVREPAGATWG